MIENLQLAISNLEGGELNFCVENLRPVKIDIFCVILFNYRIS